MRAEIGAESPLWDNRGAMVRLDNLPLRSELRDALTLWATVGWAGTDNAVNEEGRRLYAQVVECLGATTEVIWDND